MPASQASLRLTDAYRAQLLAVRRRVTVAVAGLWEIDFEELDRSFALWVGRSARLVGAAQFDMARLSAAYVAAYLASETRAPVPPVPVDPARFAGVDAFGRPLAVVLAPALLTVKAGLAEGRAPEVASAAGQARAVRTTVTTTQASADGALDSAFEAQPRVRGWRRVVSGGGCGACLGMASGQVEEPGTPMLRHANCGCTKEPVVAGVADTVRRPTGQELFDRLSDAEQDALFAGRGGADKAELVRSGAVDLAGMVRQEPQALGHPVITEAPLQALRGG